MSTLPYALMLPFILIVMLSTMIEMSSALDELDIEQFSLWTGAAAVVAGLPMLF